MNIENNFKVPNLERGLEILEHLVEQEQEVSQKELADKLGFPANSTMRIMNALEHHGYVIRNSSNKKYCLSGKMAIMHSRCVLQKNLMQHALGEMEKLRDMLKETVVISIISNGEGVILEQVQGLHPFRFVCDPGIRQPLHATSSCKVIMAYMNSKDLDPLLKKIDFKRHTPKTIRSITAMRKELEVIRKMGYALDRAELADGIHCASSPIIDRSGTPVASITVTGPSFRMPLKDLPGIGAAVREHCVRISESLCGEAHPGL